MIKANSDKENFYEQKRAVGLPEEVIDKSFEYAVIDRSVQSVRSKNQIETKAWSFREQVPTLKSYGNEILFASPWAKKLSDEEFFSQTLDSLGNIVRDDVKLGTLYRGQDNSPLSQRMANIHSEAQKSQVKLDIH